ncbi:MAG: ribosome biogenesis GTPase YlqF, partial [Veillonella sp.]|nr:ribosome biogenesis GTPase YlqF [Veillonella sp.]
GAISDDVYDLEHVIKQLLNHLLTNTPNILIERYKLKEEEMADVDTILESIGRRRGCLVSGGVVDLDKARRIILQDYRNTKLGTITLDQVDEEPYYPEDGEETHNG